MNATALFLARSPRIPMAPNGKMNRQKPKTKKNQNKWTEQHLPNQRVRVLAAAAWPGLLSFISFAFSLSSNGERGEKK